MKLIAYLLFIVLFFSPAPAYADHSFAPTNYYPIAEKVQEGSIITVKQGKYALSDTPGDLLVIGAVTSHPAITQKFTGAVPFRPVITSGIGYVLVSTINGPIKKGDFITTSSIPGVGQRATELENTIGIAEEGFREGKDVIGKIPVMINIRRGQINGVLENYIESGVRIIVAGITPMSILKLSLASTVVITSMVLSFWVLNRKSKKHTRLKTRWFLPEKRKFFTAVSHVLLVMFILYAGFTAGVLLLVGI